MVTPSRRRSREIWDCSALAALAGGSSPYTSSISRSVETTLPTSSSSSPRTDRSRAPPSSSGSPSAFRASIGPRIVNSTGRLSLIPADGMRAPRETARHDTAPGDTPVATAHGGGRFFRATPYLFRGYWRVVGGANAPIMRRVIALRWDCTEYEGGPHGPAGRKSSSNNRCGPRSGPQPRSAARGGGRGRHRRRPGRRRGRQRRVSAGERGGPGG